MGCIFSGFPQCLLSHKFKPTVPLPRWARVPRGGERGWMASLPVCLRGACSLSAAFPTVPPAMSRGGPPPASPGTALGE